MLQCRDMMIPIRGRLALLCSPGLVSRPYGQPPPLLKNYLYERVGCLLNEQRICINL